MIFAVRSVLHTGAIIALSGILGSCAPSPMDRLNQGLQSLQDDRWKSASATRLVKKIQMPAGFHVADTAWCGVSTTLVSSAASDKAILVWDADKAIVKQALERVDGSRAIACSASARFVASGRNQRKSGVALRIWDLATPQAPVDVAGPFPLDEGQNTSMVRALFFSPDSRFLYVHWITGYFSGLKARQQRLSVYETANWRRTREFVLPPVSMMFARIQPSLSSDGILYAVAHGDSALNISVFDMSSGSERLRLTGFKFRPQAVAFGRRSKTLLVGGPNMSGRIPDSKALHEYDLASLRVLRSIPSQHLWDLDTVVYREQPALIVTAGNDKTIEIRNASSGQLLETLGEKAEPLYSIAVRPDGKLLVSAGGSFINVWGMPSP